jgi:hypothetical protein
VPRSERCHQAKHHPSWSVVSHGDGSSTWTSPTGARYLTRSSLAPLLPRPKPWQPMTGQPATGQGWEAPPAAYDDEPLVPESPEV